MSKNNEHIKQKLNFRRIILYVSHLSMLHSRDDLMHGFSDESADDELENLLRKKLNRSKHIFMINVTANLVDILGHGF